ncbi:MAG: 16S rRNA (uracil(1498)-N(3))-methyltransferase, partial [Candidatus Marinimicrobia bacterium]|nr:16S rRNA (uracil(1498)-N(3))-methyltransferase [Candidatus Neomarinimicrobiota bacterium]
MITGEQVFLPAFISGQSRLTIDGSEYHHLIRVRRFNIGDEVWVVNGQGISVLAHIDKIGKDSLELVVLSEKSNRGEISQELILAVANLKGDHLNLIVEKATELGVHQIVPLLTEHTVKRGINRDRLERIAIAAMKQSRRSRLPVIQDLVAFKEYVRTIQGGTHLFCHADDASLPIIQSIPQIKQATKIFVWIGPEGDWSKDEIDLASISDYTFTGL